MVSFDVSAVTLIIGMGSIAALLVIHRRQHELQQNLVSAQLSLQMKSAQKWLEDSIKEYERLFGPIPSPEELESKTRRDPNQ